MIHTFWIQNLVQSYNNQKGGTGMRIDVETNGIGLRVQKEAHTSTANWFLTRVLRRFNDEKEWALQHTVLREVDIHMQKSEVEL